ncbi:restriction endonuclease [Pontibacillus salipaludis]|uniref:Restriction endonuclease type IV Mrr domain-containing protein n=1 Tax=Pontibacillus salipaludis TaxID=1697394 RepID=A0ABQ1QCB8_9BACI|nr:restriction endonuclease [Pontibacillus salipaludis]GGD22886.1 hypothetical protein GCM10011389_33320 [Pontibacillus salipaludis]
MTSRMSINSFTELSKVLANVSDDMFWEPIETDEDIVQFKDYIKHIEESQSWDRSRNKDKGELLEEFTMFLFNRFQDVRVTKNKRPADNETDIEAVMSEKAQPPFITQIIGPKIVCECKNKKSSSIDVGMVTKLAEILPTRGSSFGVFISINGMGGYAWRYGEGKRKKIMYKDRLPLISFTVKELEVLLEGNNFLTMIKQKYYQLLDEVDDETADIPEQPNIEYTKRLNEVIIHLEKCELMNSDMALEIKENIRLKYGEINND